MEKIIFLLLIVRYLCYSSITINGLSCEMEESKREDCGYNGIDENECVNSRGCCWREIYQNPNVLILNKNFNKSSSIFLNTFFDYLKLFSLWVNNKLLQKKILFLRRNSTKAIVNILGVIMA